MRKRIFTLLCMLFAAWGSVQAQDNWTREDAQWLKGYLEGKENVKQDKEMDRLIEKVFEGQGALEPDARPFVDFIRELPSELEVDSFAIRRSLSLHPYTVFTKWNEDPIYDKYEDYALYKNFLKNMALLTTPSNHVTAERVDPRPVFANRTQGAMMIGASVSIGFDANRILFENFTRLGRLIRHNRKVRDRIIRELTELPRTIEGKK